MTRHPARRTARAVTGLASLLALAALIAGLPAALYAVIGSPIPHAIPAWHQVTSALGRPDHGALLLAAIRWVSWLAWAAFAVSVLVEVFSQARGRTASRLPPINPVQRFAAALVGAAILGLLPGSHLPHPVPSPPRRPPAAATAPPRPGQPTWAAAATRDPQRVGAPPANTMALLATPHRQTYTVAQGDNLWDIAARQLGDPQRWREIFELNCGRPQPDGRTLGNPNLISPGWIFTLPSRPAVPAGPTHPSAPSRQPSRSARRPPVPHQGRRTSAGRAVSHPPQPDHHARTTHPPDHVSMRHGRRERPAGIHLPSGGLVGITLAAALSAALVAWRLHRRRTAIPRWPIPADRSEPPVPEAIGTLRRAHLRSVAADAAEACGEPWPGEAEPGEAGSPGWDETDDDGLDEFGAPASRTTWQPASPASRDGQHLTSPWSDGRRVTTSAAAGPLPAPVPAPGPAPATGTGRDRRAGGSPPGEARGQPAAPPARPLPAGTVVFGTRGGTEIPLSDVARLGLGLTGPGAHAAARALMIGLLAAPAPGSGPQAEVVIPAADAHQLTTGHQATAQMPGVTPGLPDGLTISPTLTSALDRIETEITHRLRETGHDSPASPQTPDAGNVAPAPLALIASVDPPSAPRVRAVRDAGAGAGIVCVVLGDWACGTTCHIGADGTVLAATGPGLVGVHAGHLPAADVAAMLSLLRGAQGYLTGQGPGPAQPPARGPDAATDPEPGRAPQQGAGSDTAAGSGGDSVHGDGTGQRPDGQQPDGQPAHHDLAQPAPRPGATPATPTPPGTGKTVVISVLGPLRIAAGGGEIRGGLRKARELLAYLAVHPEGVTGEGISADLWPESSPRYAASQRKLALRKVREMLRTATGLPTPLFITLAGERYRLDPALIGVDLWQFDAALDRAQAVGQNQLAALQQAAALYQGPLADGAGYEWAERYAEPTRRRAVDALARIAGILQPHDPEQALTVLETAVAHDPYNEAVYQDIMRIQGRLGRPDAARRTLALLETGLAGLGLSLTAATQQAVGIPASDLPQPSPL